MSSNLQLTLNQDHEVLGSEYCSGYTDALGKWNNGFYCPASDESQDVFCCGNEFHKYCCTKKDQVIQAEVEDLTIVIGIIVGASAAIFILTMVSCFCCSCCMLYKKRNLSTASSMYRLHHNSSEHSGVTNMYSFSNPSGNSRNGTPQRHHHQQQQQQQQQLHQPVSHHMSQNFLLEDVDNMRLVQSHNGGISHSFTLPHNLSSSGGGGVVHSSKAGAGVIQQYMTLNPHHASYRNDNPDLITSTHHLAAVSNAKNSIRPYGTLGHRVDQQHPTYPEFQGGNTNSAYAQFVQQQQMLGSMDPSVETTGLSSISQTLSRTGQTSQQQQPQNVSTTITTINSNTSNNQSGSRMIFPHHHQSEHPQTHTEHEANLFHSTKF